MQGFRFELHFSESMIDRITNRDDSGEFAALDYGKMAKLARGHRAIPLVPQALDPLETK